MSITPFVTDSETGRLPVNYYPAKDDQDKIVIKGTPGLVSHGAVWLGPIRAMKAAAGLIWVVTQNRVYYVESGYDVFYCGTINTSSGNAWIESNGFEICVVDETGGWLVNILTKAFSEITDAAFPAAPGSLTYQDGYFIVSQAYSGNFFINTTPYVGSAWDALDFGTSEGMPDNVVRGFVDHRELWMFNEESIDIFYNSGDADFPFSRTGGGFLEVGLAAKMSVAKVDNSIAWFTNPGQVVQAVGYNPQIISTRKLERAWQYFTWSTAEAFSYMFEGHWFYQLTFPDDDKTYVYDAATKLWHERARGELPNLHRHLASCYVKFNGEHIIGSSVDGQIYEMRSDCYTDNLGTITRILESPNQGNNGKRMFFTSLQIEFMDAGHADSTGQGSDPQAMLQWSNDGGNTWSNEHWRPIGLIGKYKNRSIWHRLGSSRNRMWRLTITDPVDPTVTGVNLVVSSGR